MPPGWVGAIRGACTVGGSTVIAPDAERLRTSVLDLGSEVLWDSGADAQPPLDGAPRVYVVGYHGQVWQGTNNPPFLAALANDGGNKCSIGLLIRFNDFFCYTFGDMPFIGENPATGVVPGRAYVLRVQVGIPGVGQSGVAHRVLTA